jgi:cold shock CspA family protein
MERKYGTVRYWSDRGFGFLMISYKDQYYCHITEWESDALPVLGQRVSWEVRASNKKLPLAVNVRPTQPVDTTRAAEILARGLPTESNPVEGGVL